MSQVIVNFIGSPQVSTGMYFRVRSKDPNFDTHADKFYDAMVALSEDSRFRDTVIDPENTRGQSLFFAQEVDAQEVMFIVIETLAARGWYFHGEGNELFVFHQSEDRDTHVSQVVVQPDDEDKSIVIRLVDVGSNNDGDVFVEAIAEFEDEQVGYSAYTLVEGTDGRMYKYGSVIAHGFAGGDLLRIITIFSHHGWIYHGEGEDNYVLYRED